MTPLIQMIIIIILTKYYIIKKFENQIILKIDRIFLIFTFKRGKIRLSKNYIYRNQLLEKKIK